MKKIITALAITLAALTVQSQNYLFNVAKEGEAAARGPFKGSTFSINLAEEESKFSITSDLSALKAENQEKKFRNWLAKTVFFTTDLSGKSNEGIINVTKDNDLDPKIKYGGSIGFMCSNTTNSGLKRDLFWLSVGLSQVKDEFNLLYIDNSYMEQLQKAKVNNNITSASIGYLKRGNSIGLRKTYWILAGSYQLQDWASNKDDLTKIDVSDQVYQQSFNDTIRTVTINQSAFSGKLVRYKQKDFRVDFTVIPVWFNREEEEKKNKKSNANCCVELTVKQDTTNKEKIIFMVENDTKKKEECCVKCEDEKDISSVAFNFYLKQSFRDQTYDFTAIGFNISILQNVDAFFSDQKTIGNKIKFTGGVGIEFKFDNEKSINDKVEAVPTFRTGIMF